MKYDFDTELVDFDGDRILWPSKKTEPDPDTGEDVPRMEPLTLGKACIQALLCNAPGDTDKPGDERLAWFGLAQRIALGGKQNLTVEEVVMIKERLGYIWTTMILGLVSAQLDNPLAEEAVQSDG